MRGKERGGGAFKYGFPREEEARSGETRGKAVNTIGNSGNQWQKNFTNTNHEPTSESAAH